MKSIASMTCLLLLAGGVSGQPTAQKAAAGAPTKYVEVEGNRIGYRVIGSGTPLIMLTRFRGTLDTWDPLFLNRLALTHRVITVDYPGVGYSTGTFPTEIGQVAAFVNGFATRIGVRRYAVLGWSWGGIIAQTVLLAYPESVSHGVLVGTAPPGPGQAEMDQAWLASALKPVNDLKDEELLFFEPKSDSSRNAARNSHERIYARPGVTPRIPATEAQFQAYFKLASEFKADVARRRERLTESQVPMLILCGDNDPSVPATNWYPLIGRIPRAQILVLPQSGHGPQHQYPELSAHYIGAFLKGW
ncbi:MAG: alpha/beta hydrolase [Bryobacteraceae bacterium]|nr:alpha/beta hydrolase [Bryobacteraceae bacterium]